MRIGRLILVSIQYTTVTDVRTDRPTDRQTPHNGISRIVSRDNNLITMKIMHSLSNANSACHSTRNTRHVADSATFCRSQLCYRERLSYRRCACLSHARNLSKLMNLGSCGFTDGQPRDFSFLDQLSYPRSQGRTITLTLTVEMPLEKTRRKHASVALRAIRV